MLCGTWWTLHFSQILLIAVALLNDKRMKGNSGLLCMNLSKLKCSVAHLVQNLYWKSKLDMCLVLSFGRKKGGNLASCLLIASPLVVGLCISCLLVGYLLFASFLFVYLLSL